MAAVSPEDLQQLLDLVAELQRRGAAPSRVRLPSGLEVDFSSFTPADPESVEQPDPSDDDGKAERRANLRDLGLD